MSNAEMKAKKEYIEELLQKYVKQELEALEK
jgi:hypothetical protein